ncbi:MAG: phage holin family protein, partial [Bacteroidales bacterium]|nr:phage holin family protein [Bacteroidales bacterium]
MDVIANPDILDHLWRHLAIGFVLSILVTIAIFVDLWDGVYTARKTGQKIHSHKLRVTGEKIGEYFRFIFIMFLIDLVGVPFSWWPLPFLTMVISVGLIGVEVKSMFEHATERKSKALQAKDVIAMVLKASTQADAKEAVKAVAD